MANYFWSNKANLVLLVLMALLLSACDKDRGGRDFIEFVIDGEHIHIEKFETTKGNIVSQLIDVGATRLLNIAFTGTVSSKPHGGALALSSNEEFAAKAYPFDGSEPGGLINFPTFYYLDGDLTAYTLMPNGSGTISLTSYSGRASGALIEGTFSMTGVEKKLDSGEVVATGLNVTNGKFSVRLE